MDEERFTSWLVRLGVVFMLGCMSIAMAGCAAGKVKGLAATGDLIEIKTLNHMTTDAVKEVRPGDALKLLATQDVSIDHATVNVSALIGAIKNKQDLIDSYGSAWFSPIQKRLGALAVGGWILTGLIGAFVGGGVSKIIFGILPIAQPFMWLAEWFGKKRK